MAVLGQKIKGEHFLVPMKRAPHLPCYTFCDALFTNAQAIKDLGVDPEKTHPVCV